MMNKFRDILTWLNNNPGIEYPIIILLAVIGWLFFNKGKKGVQKISSKGDENKIYQAGGNINITKKSTRSKTPFVDLEMDFFRGAPHFELRLILHNQKNELVSLKKILFAGQELPLAIETLGPKKKITLSFNLADFKIIKLKTVKPEIVLFYENVDKEKSKTIARLKRESRADGKFNIKSIENVKRRDLK